MVFYDPPLSFDFAQEDGGYWIHFLNFKKQMHFWQISQIFEN